TSAPTFGLGAEHIDPTTNAIVGTAEFAADGQEVVIADGFVWSLEAQHPNVNLVKIAPDRAVVVGELTGKVFFHPTGAAGHVFSYVVDGSNFSFSRVDPRTNEPISLIQPRLGGAQGVASENGRVWWGIPWDGTGPFDPGIIRFDTATGRERLIPVKDPDPFVCDREGGCRANAIAAGEGGVWFITSSHTLDRLDPKTHEVEPVPVDAATSVAVGLGSVWIADNTSTPGVVREYAPSTGKVVEEYEVGANPTAIAVGAGAVWVVNRDNGTLSRIDPEANEVAATIDVGLGARAVAADDELGVWVVR
ncbi:MAG TPA: hypothetical protein VNN79_24390, partial [Actinomycetota bacterium]|nr:hypothetical protein [Actinomycetota bacterium]